MIAKVHKRRRNGSIIHLAQQFIKQEEIRTSK